MKINRLLRSSYSIQEDWKPYILNVQIIRHGNSITWPGYSSGVASQTPAPVTVADVNRIRSSRQYSLMILDGSLIQMRYVFNPAGDHVEEASLSYLKAYPDGKVNLIELITRAGSWGEESLLADCDESDIVGGLRLDYSPQLARGPLHAAGHLHLHGLEGARLVINSLPTPRRFLELIFALCYPEVYSDVRLNAVHDFKSIPRVAAIFGARLKTLTPLESIRYYSHLNMD